MLKKVKNITNVGRFKNFQGTDDSLSFDRNTFIFGQNTKGKSTLTAILKSLTTNNNDCILGRKTFGGVNQNVVLDIESEHIFSQSWNRNAKIKIFDNDYILENIFSDNTITEDKQKKIATIILGEEGKRLESIWTKTKEDIEANGNRKNEISRAYSSSFDKNLLNFDDFLKLEKGADLLFEIDKKTNELKILGNEYNINKILKEIFEKIDEFTLEEEILSGTLVLDQGIIKKHIADNIKDKTKVMTFFPLGLNLIKNEKCPFCSQEIVAPASELIDAYNILFSKKYQILRDYIQKALTFVNARDMEQVFLEKGSNLKDLGLQVDFTMVIEQIKENKKLLSLELTKKKDNLTYSIDINILNILYSAIEEGKSMISELQKKYKEMGDIEKGQELRKTLSILETSKKRFEAPRHNLCIEYQELDKKYKEKLKPKEIDAFEKKTLYASSVLTSSKETINDILCKLGAGFELTEFIMPENRREVIKLFGLKFSDFDENIPLINSMGYDFKNTLSDSDKRLLAFAFFVVDIKNTANLSDYIIVLDDPMSSFDVDRKRHTIKILRDELFNNSGDKPEQLIVLTHESNFFILLNTIFRTEKTFLRIQYFPGEGTSKIIPCDLNEEFLKEEHYKKFDYYKACLQDEFENIDLSNMRIILEEVIKSKYYPELTQETIDSGGIVSWYKDNKADANLSGKISDIEPHLAHHTQSNSISEDDYEESEKKSMIRDFLSLITDI